MRVTAITHQTRCATARACVWQYVPHYDNSARLRRRRVATCLYYLNSVGATWFPLAATAAAREPLEPCDVDRMGELLRELEPPNDGLHVAGCAGDALAFFHYDESGELDPLALHAGLPAPATRWVASQFFSVDASPRAAATVSG